MSGGLERTVYHSPHQIIHSLGSTMTEPEARVRNGSFAWMLQSKEKQDAPQWEHCAALAGEETDRPDAWPVKLFNLQAVSRQPVGK